MSPRRWATALLACIALVIGSSAPALAAPPGTTPAKQERRIAAPTPKKGRQISGPTTLAKPDAVNAKKTAKEREPLAPTTKNAPRKLLKEATPAPAAACSVSDFTGNSGAALVNAIKGATVDCINSLFSITGTDQYYAFREAQMVTVANALRDNAGSYNGTNSTSTEQLVLYLRAGYYVQYYNPSTVGPYTQTLATASEGALDAFYASGASGTVSDANGEILGEAVTLIDSAGENARYLYVVKRLLNAYNGDYEKSWYMRNAVNNVFTVLFRGQWAPGYPAAVQADPSIVDTVNTFARNHMNYLGGDYAFLDVNAGGELARFVQYAGLQSKVRPLIKWLLDNSGITGTRAALWVRVAEVTNGYEEANCSYYGTCDLANRVKAAVLTQTHTCSANVLHVIAQSMTTQEFQDACTSMLNQNAYFHDMMQDGGKPVGNDYNSNMEVVVFHSSDDYQTYAGVIFGIDTNNGGMYLEGDPAVQGNQPRFIAYQKPTDDGFAARIWNLNHEYTHYLDGRYNTYGDFTAETVKPNIWWIEGVAEYVSYSYRNLTYTDALNEAKKHTYALSTLFDTTYENTNVDRTYHWGYLAVRYMFEKHRSDLTRILGYYRSGDYTAAYNLTKSLNYDSDFSSWLDALSGGGNPDPGQQCTDTDTRVMGKNCQRSNVSATTGNYAYFYLWVPTGTSSLSITASGGTGNADLYFNPNTWATTSAYTSRSAKAGNAESLTVSGLRAGAYNYVSLYAASSFSGVTITTRY
ncbi:M9 family metallopeptidase [Actinomadura barringtoniae]|uniref:microbial collagenase n=1 Tax=Actinomadura barringtoniae TaxID=1427535 RepID=A0A939T198_9ACTN|nr:M9 family metallopeptidase [Actinomadura barringtoniae]MBO2447081.1 M9 family metallopeptidase [Actinomadura barringtoniae]